MIHLYHLYVCIHLYHLYVFICIHMYHLYHHTVCSDSSLPPPLNCTLLNSYKGKLYDVHLPLLKTFKMHAHDLSPLNSTLATWCEELTHWKRPWCWERLKAGGEPDNRGRNGWMVSLTRWTWASANSKSWWWTREGWCAAVHGVTKSWIWLSNWTELNYNSEHTHTLTHTSHRKADWLLKCPVTNCVK